ncbi:MAG: HisA/HisF-related TIM barrel protein [Isosphaeraceae bacterium]
MRPEPRRLPTFDRPRVGRPGRSAHTGRASAGRRPGPGASRFLRGRGSAERQDPRSLPCDPLVNQDSHSTRSFRPAFRVIPVIDLRGGIVVHARGGVRSNYRPVESRLVSGANPREPARAFRDRLGLHELYAADLDAIAGQPPDHALLNSLSPESQHVIADLGIRGPEDALAARAQFGGQLIVGSESIRGRQALQQVVAAVGRVVFSLDLRDVNPVRADAGEWSGDNANALLDDALSVGVRTVILLDLNRVGTGQGSSTSGKLLAWLLDRDRTVEVLIGGGVGSVEDLHRLRDQGAHGALVATALHNGRIQAGALRRLVVGD